MSEWFTWKGENFYAVRGADLFFLGSAVKRFQEEKWEAYAQGEPVGVFSSEAAARRRVEELVTAERPVWLARPGEPGKDRAQFLFRPWAHQIRQRQVVREAEAARRIVQRDSQIMLNKRGRTKSET